MLASLPRPALLVAIATAVGGVLRIVLVQQDLFADELATYWIVDTNGVGGVVSTVHSNAEISPPLSFVASWLTSQVSLSAVSVRVPALIAGIATIPIVYLLGRRTVGRDAGALAAVFTALAPFMAYYSAEARGYGLMMAFVALSTLALLEALDDRRARWWVAYALLVCAAMYTHYTCVFVLAAQLLWALWAHPEARRTVLVANVGAAVLYLPWVSGLLKDTRSPTTDILSALQPFDWFHVRISLTHWSIGYPYTAISLRALPGTVALVAFGAAAVAAVAGLVLTRASELRALLERADRRAVLVFGLALATPVCAALFSATGGTSVFSTRNLAASWPYLGLATAAVLLAAGPRLRWAAAGLAVVGFAIGAVKLLDADYSRPDYTTAVELVEEQARPGDVVIDETAILSPGPYSHLDPILDGPVAVQRARAPEQKDHPFGLLDKFLTVEEGRARAVARAGDGRIFYVTPVRDLPAALDGHRLADERELPGIVPVFLGVYEPSG